MTFDREGFHREAVATPSDEDVSEMRSLLLNTLAAAGHEPEVDAVPTYHPTGLTPLQTMACWLCNSVAIDDIDNLLQ